MSAARARTPEVGQRWKHRTTNPAHQHYGRVVTIEQTDHTLVRIKGKHRSTWARMEFMADYAYLDTPEPVTPDPEVPVSEQLTLDLEPLTTPDYTPAMSIQQRFELFHAANPWVLRAYESLTADWQTRGHTRAGIGMFTEIIRWQYGRTTTGREFRIDNNFRSRYVRLMLERNPGWAGLFETRELRTR